LGCTINMTYCNRDRANAIDRTARMVRSVSVKRGRLTLALQHQDLVAQREDLGVSLVAGREKPSEATDEQVTETRGEVHRRQNVSTDRTARNSPKRSGDGFPAPTGC
jgi:hypothetical protein